jgi:hypothetical protein
MSYGFRDSSAEPRPHLTSSLSTSLQKVEHGEPDVVPLYEPDGVQQVALARRIRPHEHRQGCQGHFLVGEALEILEANRLEHPSALAQRPNSAEARGQSSTTARACASPPSAALTARATDVEHLKGEGGVLP